MALSDLDRGDIYTLHYGRVEVCLVGVGVSLIAGVDDAGRGPVIGPLVVAGVLVYQDQVSLLRDMGVRDSKTLSPGRRGRLAARIKGMVVDYRVLEVSPGEIDEVVFRGKRLRRLNWLEAKAMAEVLEGLGSDVAYVDASDVVESRFGEQIRGMLSREVEVVSEHHADSRYPVVSAASILAKEHREDVVSGLRDVHGDFGSGYCHDARTRRFLLDWLRNHRGEELPCYVRRSWRTVARLRSEAAVME